MITNIEQAREALARLSAIEGEKDLVNREYKEDIDELAGQIQILMDGRDCLLAERKKEEEVLSDDLKTYILENWKRDFDGKKSISFPEGRMFVRSSTLLDIADEEGVAERLVQLGCFEALKIKPNKTVLKEWSEERLGNIGVRKAVIDNPGFKAV